MILTTSTKIFTLIGLFCFSSLTLAEMDAEEAFLFDDQPVKRPMQYPHWFKDSLMDFQEDLADLFFDTQGQHIITLDSVAHFTRRHNVLTYVTQGAYKRYPKFQDWRIKQR